MNSENNKRREAEQLLRAIGEIDDRFLLEAMKLDETSDISGQPETDSKTAQMSGQIEKTDESGEKAGQTSESVGTPASRKGRLRRYSTWALTAAACLTVVIIGRYVSVSSVKSGEEQAPVAVVEEKQPDTAVPDAMKEADPADEAAAMEDAVEKSDEKTVAPKQADAAGEAEKDAAGEAEMDAVGEAEKDAAGEAEMDVAEEAQMDAAEDAEMDMAGEAQEAAADTPMMNATGLAQRASEAAGAGSGVALTMPNPFVDTKTLEEAEKEAGFSITLPEGTKPYDKQIYRAMKDQMIEVIYVDKDNREVYRIRKGKNMEDDISGIYFEHVVSDTLKSDGLEITVNGEEKDKWSAAVWTQEKEDGIKYSYSICSGQTFLEEDEIKQMAEEMMTEL